MSHVDKAEPLLPNLQVAEAGLEHGGEPPVKTGISQRGGAESGAVDDLINADLRAIIEAWPTLTESTKAGIVAMIKAKAP